MSANSNDQLSGPSRRRLLGYGLGLSAAGILAHPGLLRAQPAPLRSVTFGFQWFASGAYAGYYFAKDRGYYAERGLDVTFKHVLGNALALQLLAAGNADLIHADFIQMLQLQGRSPELHLRAAAVIAEKLALSLFYLKGRGISQPKDLEGRSIVDSPGSTAPLLFKMFADANGVDAGKVVWKNAAATAKVVLMLQEEADAVAIYLNARPSILARLRPGQELAWFMFGERGANIYGDGVITTDRFLKERRDVLGAFVQASARGFKDAYADMRAGVEPICRAFPELNRDLAVQELEAMREVGIGPAQQVNGIGYIEPEKMQATYDAVVKLLGQPIGRPVSDLYINLI